VSDSDQKLSFSVPNRLESMAKLPEYIEVSPLTLACSRCGAKPGMACGKIDDVFDLIHVERIAAAAALDVKARKLRAAKPS
jgi:hypothetical protein